MSRSDRSIAGMFAQTADAETVIGSARPSEKCAEAVERLLALDVDDTSSSPDVAHGPGTAEQRLRATAGAGCEKCVDYRRIVAL